MILLVLGISVFALLVAGALARWVLSKDTGTEKMREISDAIAEGAHAFIKRQYLTIGLLSLALAVIIYAAYFFIGKQELGTQTSIAFIFGAFSFVI